MERCDEDVSLPRHDGLAPVPRQDLHAGSDPADPRRADEHHLDGPVAAVEGGRPVRLERLGVKTA